MHGRTRGWNDHEPVLVGGGLWGAGLVGEQWPWADLCCTPSHFHLDHCGALPYFSEMVGYDGPIYMTHPTQAICPILLEDYRKIAVDKKGEANFFTSQMIKDCMKKVVAVHLHQTVQVRAPAHPISLSVGSCGATRRQPWAGTWGPNRESGSQSRFRHTQGSVPSTHQAWGTSAAHPAVRLSASERACRPGW